MPSTSSRASSSSPSAAETVARPGRDGGGRAARRRPRLHERERRPGSLPQRPRPRRRLRRLPARRYPRREGHLRQHRRRRAAGARRRHRPRARRGHGLRGRDGDLALQGDQRGDRGRILPRRIHDRAGDGRASAPLSQRAPRLLLRSRRNADGPGRRARSWMPPRGRTPACHRASCTRSPTEATSPCAS